jgi:TRAP transporter TAXI family solute receptor
MRGLFGRALIAIALVAITIAGVSAGPAQTNEYDPSRVSNSLKAILQFGSAQTKQALNANAVTMITGTIDGTYVQLGADLASVLDDGNKLRVLPIVGRGSVQNIADMLLEDFDLGIVRADSLDYLERKGYARDLRKQLTYVTKLYNEEMQVIAPLAVRNLRDLDDKKVGVDLPDGGTFVTCMAVFERLGLRADNFTYIEQRIAMEMLNKGELDAVIVVGGKPYKSVSNFVNDGRFHLVTVDYEKPLQNDYLPATLTSKDYPNLIADGDKVDTIAVPAVLAAYNWAPNTDRYRKLSLFVDAFFSKFATLQNPPFHPKWKEVSLTAPLPGWQRLPYANKWLEEHGLSASSRNRFDEFLKQNPTAAKNIQSEADREALFKQYQAWEADKGARAQVGR